MHASSASARIGGAPVVFSGRVGDLGAPIPAGGRPVELQFRFPGSEWSEFRTIQTDAKADVAGRITQIHADLAEILAEHKPDSVAVEKLYAHYKHPRTSILMAHARGAILLACRQAGLGVRDLPATKVKKSLTGNGHASKRQVQRAVQAACKLDQSPEPPDVADALALALCAGRQATDYTHPASKK